MALLRYGRLSRTEIMEIVGISPGSVTRLTAPLVESGLLATRTEQPSGVGRPQSPLELRADAESVVGIHVAGRMLTAVLADLHLDVLAATRHPLRDGSPEAAVSAAADAVSELRASVPGTPAPTCAGVTLEGAIRDSRTLEESARPQWRGLPLADMVGEGLGMPVVVGNDLVASALHEARVGADRDHDRMALVALGAGVGFALVADGDVVTTPEAELGLVGRVPIPDDGAPAPAAPAAELLTDAALEKAWTEASGTVLRAAEIADLAARGDAAAVAVCSVFARALGRLIGIAAAFTLPEMVVVAGERAEIAEVMEDRVAEGIASVRRPGADLPPIVVHAYGSTHRARGAACLARETRVTGRI